MEQFLRIDDNIVRCAYTMEPRIQNTSLFIDPEMMNAPPVERCPIRVKEVTFSPREIYRCVPDGKPVIKVTQTVDGQRTAIENLKEEFDRQAWRAVLQIEFQPDEHIYGLGQDEDGVLDKRGHIEYLYQHNMKIPMPMFVSSLGYGVLFNCACLMIFDDTGSQCKITFECVDQLDFFVITGGFDGWWCDSTEPFTAPDWCGEGKLPESERYAMVGGEHEKYLDPSAANAFALVHAQGIYENQPQKPVVNLTRSGWAGVQKYGTVLWAGDTSATWDALRSEVAKGLNMSFSGIPYWTVDAGAFFTGSTNCWRKWKGDPNAAPVWFWNGDYDDGVADKGYQELYTHWLQFTCFLPIFRSHGTDTPREVWNFEEPFRGAIIRTIRLRYRLMPYIKEMFRKVHEEDFTIMRSLLFDFAGDERCALINDQFMFGTDLLVCPVTVPHLYTADSCPVRNASAGRLCYLPAGADWYDFHTGEFYRGGQSICVPVTLEHIPVFVRAGAKIPVTEGLTYAQQESPVTFLEFPNK